MLTRADLQAFAEARLEDARVLQASNRYSGAYYLCGYTVELALKACIAKAFQADAIPQKAFVNAIYTHRLAELLGLAGLKSQLDADAKANAQLLSAWGIVAQWSEESRYSQWDAIAAKTLLDGVGNQNYGVFQWIKKHW